MNRWKSLRAAALVVVGVVPLLGSADMIKVVSDLTPTAVVLEDPPESANERTRRGITRAKDLLLRAAKLATGVELQTITLSPGEPLPEGPVILLGGGPRTQAEGFSIDGLQAEDFRVEVRGRLAALYGSPADGAEEFLGYLASKTPYNPTTFWAVAEVVANQWGGRWLWPSDSGFYLPTTQSLTIQSVSGTLRPVLESRKFGFIDRVNLTLIDPATWDRMSAEAEDWMRFHHQGSRSRDHRGRHAFKHWLDTYGQSDPDLLAQPPQGQQPDGRADRQKLRDGNPRVIETIVDEWEAAGRPPAWSVGPNDGAFFCTAPESLAMDEPANQDPNAIWRGEGQLSARIAKFYNAVARAIQARGGQVTLNGYAYGCYRDAPRTAEPIQFAGPIVLAFVHGFDENAKAQWLGWRETGAEPFLRPNWLHSGATAPYLQTARVVNWMNWAAENGSRAWYFDSLLGDWGTQGLNYYAVARAGAEPGLTPDEILDEYTDAFGSAKDIMAEYFRYWEEYAMRADYPASAGGVYGMNPDGLYAQAVEQHGIPPNPFSGSHWAILYLYGDDVVAPAQAILDRAEAASQNDPAPVRDRIAFVRAGLDHLVATRETAKAGRLASENPTPENQSTFRELRRDLTQLRAKLTPQHVIWGDILEAGEKRSRSPVAGTNQAYDPRDDLAQ